MIIAAGFFALMQQAAVPTSTRPPTVWSGGDNPTMSGYGATSAGSVRDTAGVTLTYKTVGTPKAAFGVLRSAIPVDSMPSPRVRITGEIKTTDVPQGVSLWLRIDDARGRALKLDNGQERAVKGTSDWTRFETLFDVPPGATSIVFGVILWGTGEATVRGLRVEGRP